MRAGDDDRARAPEKVIANRFRQRAVADLAIEDFLEFRVAARNRVADDDQVDVARDVFGTVAGERPDVFGREKLAHRRVHVLIRSLDVEPLALEHRGQRRHRSAAHANQMNLHDTADSSMTSLGRPVATTRAATPNGKVVTGPFVWPDGKPMSTGPGKSLSTSAMTARPVIPPFDSSQPGSSPMTIAVARDRMPAWRSCVTMRS